jgi:hypothetical protein
MRWNLPLNERRQVMHIVGSHSGQLGDDSSSSSFGRLIFGALEVVMMEEGETVSVVRR